MMPFSKALHEFEVTEADFPVFDGQVVHKACSTYKLGQEMEWGGRRVYLTARLKGEDAVGTFLNVKHHAPALLGDRLLVEAEPVSFIDNRLVCTVRISDVQTGKLICAGETGQMVMSEIRIAHLFG